MSGVGVCQSAQAELFIWKKRFPLPVNSWRIGTVSASNKFQYRLHLDVCQRLQRRSWTELSLSDVPLIPH